MSRCEGTVRRRHLHPHTRRAFTVAAILCLGLIAFAFVAAPRSCEWGLSAYFWAGVAVVLAFLATPFVLRSRQPLAGRAGLGLGLGVLGLAAWVAGLFAAGVRIMCRLF